MKWNVFIGQQQTAAKAKGKKTPAAAAGRPGDKAVDAGEEWLLNKKKVGDSDKENEGGNLATEMELGDTPKLKPRVSKRQKQNDEFQKQVINLLDQEDDDIDLCFSSLSKKLKRSQTEREIDVVIDKLSDLVSRHVRQARIKRVGEVSLLVHQVQASTTRFNRSNWYSNRVSMMLQWFCH